MPKDLPTNDKALVEAARRGEVWKAPGTPFPIPEHLADPHFVRAMPAIRATTIRALCLGLWEGVAVDPKGVVICGARIDGMLDLSFGTARSPLCLLHCHLADQLDILQSTLPFLNLSGSRLEAGLVGDRAQITGGLFCRAGFTATEAVRLLGADIGGILDLSKASLSIANRNGRVLATDGATIKGGLHCMDLNAEGEVRLLGADIGGDLALIGASLDGGDGYALNATGAVIRGHVFCRDGFTVAGTTDFVRSHVDGVFDWRPKSWTGGLDMSHARVGPWRDGWTGDGWSCAEGERTLVMTDFVYDGFFEADDVHRDALSRIAWIRAALGEDYRPGPYEVLAGVLRRAGDDDGAKEVLRAKRQDQRRHQRCLHQKSLPLGLAWLGPVRHAFSVLLDWTVGYGYRPWLGIPWLLSVLLFGWFLFSVHAPTTVGGSGVIKPSVPVTFMRDLDRHRLVPGPDGQAIKVPVNPDDRPQTHAVHYRLPTEYTPFNAFWYALDTLIPLIDLGQERAWSPSPFGTLRDDPVGWAVLGYLYVHILLGWTLSTLTVVALTGLIKRDRE